MFCKDEKLKKDGKRKGGGILEWKNEKLKLAKNDLEGKENRGDMETHVRPAPLFNLSIVG